MRSYSRFLVTMLSDLGSKVECDLRCLYSDGPLTDWYLPNEISTNFFNRRSFKRLSCDTCSVNGYLTALTIVLKHLVNLLDIAQLLDLLNLLWDHSVHVDSRANFLQLLLV